MIVFITKIPNSWCIACIASCGPFRYLWIRSAHLWHYYLFRMVMFHSSLLHYPGGTIQVMDSEFCVAISSLASILVVLFFCFNWLWHAINGNKRIWMATNGWYTVIGYKRKHMDINGYKRVKRKSMDTSGSNLGSTVGLHRGPPCPTCIAQWIAMKRQLSSLPSQCLNVRWRRNCSFAEDVCFLHFPVIQCG